MDRKRMGATNKRKGHNAERYYASIFKELGFSHCQTSRLASRLHDNALIDLVFIPFNIQVKAGKQKNMSPGKELFTMSAKIKSMFPKEDILHTYPKLLIHYKEVGRGNKRAPESEILYMSLLQFKEFKKQIPELTYDGIKKFKYGEKEEFNDIVNMTFYYFVENVIKKIYINDKNSDSK